MRGGLGAGFIMDEAAQMRVDNPALYDWTMIGKGGVAWYRGRWRIQKAVDDWGLHEYPSAYRPGGDPRVPGTKYHGHFKDLAGIEAFIDGHGGPGGAPQTTSTARALMWAVTQYMNDAYGPVGVRRLPDGLRLEMHPLVLRHIMREPGSLGWPEDLGGQFGVPVKVTHDLAEGHWRLAIVTEEELLGGRI